MNKRIILTISILILTTLAFAGCLDFFILDDVTVTYQSYQTKISYTISYGYNISCTGSGKYDLRYDCDDPELISGSLSALIIHNLNYETKTLATHNTVYNWDITSTTNKDYNLGITVNVQAESYLWDHGKY